MIKSLLIALFAAQSITLDTAFDLGYKIGYLNYCKYYQPGVIDMQESFYMAIDDLTEDEKQMVREIGSLEDNNPVKQARQAGLKKAVLACLRQKKN